MNNIYQSQVVFVSGASRGLGKHLAMQLVERGAHKIYATARDQHSLRDLVEISGGKIIPLTMELSDRQSVEAAVSAARDASIIINNAGILHFGNVLTMPMEKINQDMEVNHFGTLRVIREFYPHLKQHNAARIVNILSIVSLASKAGIGGYATSKSAAYSATQAVRGTMLKENIKVHAAFPGGMDTEMLAAVTTEDKDDPNIIATEILDQVADDIMDIFPGHGKEVGELWKSNPRQLQYQFTGA